MRINIASSAGRSHMLDIARELAKYGHDVRFYSYVPDKRAELYGLEKKYNYSLFWLALPFLILKKITNNALWTTNLRHVFFDHYVAWSMKPCDVFIGHSPMHYHAIKKAKEKWNAITILERGTSHVLEYEENQKDIPGFKKFPKLTLRLDLRGYDVADYISVGAEHVKSSFLKHGFDSERIFVNNYGFDSSQFHPTKLESNFDIIMVGTWSYRKGCDYIIEACRLKGYTCLHVGPIGDIDMPTDSHFTDIGRVDQRELEKYYAKAKVFVLPSREEGLALVQLQAVACGLPLVCSPNSGGRDIRKYCDKPEYIIELNELNTMNLCSSIDYALQLSNRQIGKRNYAGTGLKGASFEGYGRRYNEFLEQISK